MKYINEALNVFLKRKKDFYWSVPFGLLCLWTLDSFLSIFLTGLRTFNMAYLIATLIKLTVIILNLYFIWNLFIKYNKDLYRRFKYYSGYFIVLTYVIYSFPRLSWQLKGLTDNRSDIYLWILCFISFLYPLTLYISLWYKKFQFSWGLITKRELEDKKYRKEMKLERAKSKKGFLRKLVDNIDIFVQTILIVIVIQHFFFQLYQIPTESMVPTFLVKDRTLVTKYQVGPKIPLTDWKLPKLSKYKRGDVIVFESPEYVNKSLFKRVMHQFFFYLSLTRLDIDKDPSGNIRVRFVVKRLVGMPGEQLQMVDDVLYVKTSEDEDFKVLEQDRDSFSHVDLYNENSKVVSKIRNIMVTAETREILNKWDNWKKDIDSNNLSSDIKSEYSDFKNQYYKFRKVAAGNLSKYFNSINLYPGSDLLERRISFSDLGKSIYQDIDKFQYDIILFHSYLKDPALLKELEQYLFSVNNSDLKLLGDMSLYEKNAVKLNLKAKHLFIKTLNLYLDFFIRNSSELSFTNLMAKSPVYRDNQEFNAYIKYFYDNRNFPVFPEKEYIPEDGFFLMGDNRYNSLDFRYKHGASYLRDLDKYDPMSIVYRSSLDLHTLDKSRILGKAIAKFWPLNRMSIIK